MKNTVTSKEMLDYLQMFLTVWLADKKKYGMDDRFVQKDMDKLLACKSMVETLIGVPVNLQMNGEVTIGF